MWGSIKCINVEEVIRNEVKQTLTIQITQATLIKPQIMRVQLKYRITEHSIPLFPATQIVFISITLVENWPIFRTWTPNALQPIIEVGSKPWLQDLYLRKAAPSVQGLTLLGGLVFLCDKR